MTLLCRRSAVRFALQRNDLSAAVQWWKKGGVSETPDSVNPEGYPYHVYEYLLITQARLCFAIGQDTGDTGQHHRALELLQSILPEVERFKRLTSRIEILVLQAMIENALDDHERAVNTLLSALALGEPEEYRRIYLDEGPAIAALLEDCRDKQRATGAYSPSLQYITSLLEACRREAGLALEPLAAVTVKGVERPDLFLSTRETQVLLLIAQGKSNQEIAEELVVAVNTVKRHAYNIYAKLEVKKRTQAVSKARQLGIIP
jgi:LuxR family maltose regulon positive regulatory protein